MKTAKYMRFIWAGNLCTKCKNLRFSFSRRNADMSRKVVRKKCKKSKILIFETKWSKRRHQRHAGGNLSSLPKHSDLDSGSDLIFFPKHSKHSGSGLEFRNFGGAFSPSKYSNWFWFRIYSFGVESILQVKVHNICE